MSVIFYMPVADAIEAKIAKHGGIRPAARAMKISAPYLLRLRNGHNMDPSDNILRKLGLRRVIQFVPVNSSPRQEEK